MAWYKVHVKEGDLGVLGYMTYWRGHISYLPLEIAVGNASDRDEWSRSFMLPSTLSLQRHGTR